MLYFLIALHIYIHTYTPYLHTILTLSTLTHWLTT